MLGPVALDLMSDKLPSFTIVGLIYEFTEYLPSIEAQIAPVFYYHLMAGVQVCYLLQRSQHVCRIAHRSLF